MNILYIMRYWPVYGGGETITATLANEFVRRGHNVFIAYQYDNVVSPMPYEVDSRIKTFKTHTIEKFGKNDVMSLHNYIINNNIDVMINQWGDSRLCAKLKRVQIVDLLFAGIWTYYESMSSRLLLGRKSCCTYWVKNYIRSILLVHK